MTTSPAAREPGPGSFVDRLRIGEYLPVPDDSLVTWDISPLHAERRVKPLLDPVRPDLRVHINKWGAGGELSIRDGLLAGVPDEERSRTNCRIAAALAADGGKAYAL